jgi:hypothetical protein
MAAELDASDVAVKPFTIIGDDLRVDILTVAGSITFERAWPTNGIEPIRTTVLGRLAPPVVVYIDAVDCRSQRSSLSSDGGT